MVSQIKALIICLGMAREEKTFPIAFSNKTTRTREREAYDYIKDVDVTQCFVRCAVESFVLKIQKHSAINSFESNKNSALSG